MEIRYTCDYRVRFYECDAIGHLNNVVYVKYMHDAANQASRAVGLDREDYMKISRSWLVRETKIEYLAPLQYGELSQNNNLGRGYAPGEVIENLRI